MRAIHSWLTLGGLLRGGRRTRNIYTSWSGLSSDCQSKWKGRKDLPIWAGFTWMYGQFCDIWWKILDCLVNPTADFPYSNSTCKHSQIAVFLAMLLTAKWNVIRYTCIAGIELYEPSSSCQTLPPLPFLLFVGGVVWGILLQLRMYVQFMGESTAGYNGGEESLVGEKWGWRSGNIHPGKHIIVWSISCNAA